MGNKVSIIGAGKVGASIAYTMAVDGTASEIVLIDIDSQRAFGEAMDIRQGAAYISPANIYSGDYDDAKNSDIVIITCGISRKPGQTRLDLAKVNTEIIRSIIPKIVPAAPEATYIIVANPVDILTYTFAKYSGVPANRIIGTGTILDTARLKAKIAQAFNLNMGNVHAVVLGEHGDTSFTPWSLCTIAGVNIPEFLTKKGIALEGEYSLEAIEQHVRTSGSTIIAAKGATYYAISLCTNHISKCVFHGIDTVLPVSSLLQGEYGISDVCLSTQNLISNCGVKQLIESPLHENELEKLYNSANALKKVIKDIGI